MRPGPQGLFNRVSCAISPDRNRFDDALVTSTSMGFWQGLRDWVLTGPYRQPMYIRCDGQARGHQTPPGQLCGWFAIKVGFAFPDILRFACAVKRQVQFLSTTSAAPQERPRHPPFRPCRSWQLCKSTSGTWHCTRHAGYYRFMKKHEQPMGSHERRASSSLAERLQQTHPPKESSKPLTEDSHLQLDVFQVAKSRQGSE